MENNLKELYFDLPIKYKELSIFPVTMKDYLEFHWLVNCLLLDKNSIPDVHIISMSYLRFLYHISSEESLPYIYMLRTLLCMVLHIDIESDIKFYVDERDKAFFSLNNIQYTASDFDNIVKIIFEQNSIKPIDETIQKEIRDALEQAEQFKMRQNNQKICSLEEQMICVLISTSLISGFSLIPFLSQIASSAVRLLIFLMIFICLAFPPCIGLRRCRSCSCVISSPCCSAPRVILSP